MTEVKQYTLEELNQLTWQWSEDRGINANGKLTTQALKLVSEVGELADNVAKGKDIKDDIGDCMVVLTNLATLHGVTVAECWSHAYNDIKDRKGFLNKQGNFIKSTDEAYEKLLAEHNGIVTITDIIFTRAPSLFNTYEVAINLSNETHVSHSYVINTEIPVETSRSWIGEDTDTFYSAMDSYGYIV